jgi:very-short-patch-repair endonuclease
MIKDTADVMNEVLSAAMDSMAFAIEQESQKYSWRGAAVSPLEQIIGTGLFCVVQIYNVTATFKGVPSTAKFISNAGGNWDEIQRLTDLPVVTIWHQVKVGNYVADFVMRRQQNEKTSWVAIECDGHEFHERTKEQAQHDRSRDRFFQSQGLAILRFTGSEIWRDPTKVVMEIYEFAVKKVSG